MKRAKVELYRCTCGAEVEAESVQLARGWFWDHQMGKTAEKCRTSGGARLTRVGAATPSAINSEGADR